MTRRTFLLSSAALASAAPAAPRLGIATTSYMTYRRPRDTYEFLEYCHGLGAAGIQASLSSLDPAYIQKLRARAEEFGMYIEIMCGLPKEDTEPFAKTLAAAKEAGATVARTACLLGRRYETFSSLAEWTQFSKMSRAAIGRAVKIAERQKIPFAVENHKDWTALEFEGILREFESPWLGVCLDFGNNLSLLDQPMEPVERLAKYTISTHIKDMGLEPYDQGFLLSELPLGKGMLPLKEMVAAISKARPETKFTLEMITRNPLQVPCLTKKYWATFPDRGGDRVGELMELARASKPPAGLPRYDGLARDAQLQAEDKNVRECLASEFR